MIIIVIVILTKQVVMITMMHSSFDNSKPLESIELQKTYFPHDDYSDIDID